MRVYRVLAALGLPLLVATCSSDTPVAPGGPGVATLHVRAVAPPSLVGPGLAVEQIRATLIHLAGQTADTVSSQTVPFNVNDTTVNISFNLVLASAAETLTVALDYQTSAGQTLFQASQQVVARAGVPTTTPPLTPTFVGPGGNVAALTIQPRSGNVMAGDTLTFSVTATDTQQAPVTSFYVSWHASAGAINALGAFKAPLVPGPVRISAHTPNGTADSVTVNVLAAGAGSFAGHVLDAGTGLGLGGVVVTVLDANQALVATDTTAADGSFATPALAPGTYEVVATINGYVATSVFNALLPGGGSTTLPTIPLAPTSSLLGGITGTIKDATNNAPIIGASVTLRSGINATTGTTLDSVITDSAGVYSFIRKPVGTYSVTAADSGYLSATRTSVVLGGVTDSLQGLFLAPSAGGSEIRVVLTWDSIPQDLDLHMTGPDTTSTSRFHVYFGNLGATAAAPYDSLEYDVITGFGPETNLLAKQFPGVYRVYVFDYTDGAGGDTASTALAASGARVDLYIPGQQVQSYFVPNQAGTLWNVFTLSGTTVTPVGTVTETSDYTDLLSISPWTGPGGDTRAVLRDILTHPKH
ncbi:MAG TPA: carboxypeptidase regulatory-like domain-containing protein [Gemmatimonadales bacterium]|nr:carboxypeptidase regulatory-like domain-containing protein [Gemmatimonadales bacterium]